MSGFPGHGLCFTIGEDLWFQIDVKVGYPRETSLPYLKFNAITECTWIGQYGVYKSSF